MCGRLSGEYTWDELYGLYAIHDKAPALNVQARWNIAPTQRVVVIRNHDGERPIAAMMRWCLVPSWLPEPKPKLTLINARSETVATKPAFRTSFKTRRCIVPASGWYEWREERAVKQPYYFRDREGGILSFAGIWTRWDVDPANVIDSVAIITTGANDDVAMIHDRMPLILEPAEFAGWLGQYPPDIAKARLTIRPATRPDRASSGLDAGQQGQGRRSWVDRTDRRRRTVDTGQKHERRGHRLRRAQQPGSNAASSG